MYPDLWTKLFDFTRDLKPCIIWLVFAFVFIFFDAFLNGKELFKIKEVS